MSLIARFGTADIQVPAGQSIVIGSFGLGTTKIYYGQAPTAANVPTVYTLNSQLSGASATLGPFANGQAIRIEAAQAGEVEYVVGAAPQLTQSNPSQMPTIQMGVGQRFLASVANGLVAHAGGGQGSGTLCTADINRFITVATAADSGLLPPSVAGMEITVNNAAAANSMNLFPATGDQINALGANAAFAIAAGKSAVFSCAVAGQWHAVLTA